MAPTADEPIRDVIMRNARAAEKDRLRGIARGNWPDLNDDDLEVKVRELELDKLSKAGKLGRATQQRHIELGRRFLELLTLARTADDETGPAA